MAQNTPALVENNATKNLVPFAKGVSGNPGGRPKTRHISEALRDELDALAPDGKQTNAQAIARRLVTTARDAKRDSQATQAAEMIADRIEGKPMQSLSLQPPLDENTVLRIHEMSFRLLSVQQLAELGVFSQPQQGSEPLQTKAPEQLTGDCAGNVTND